MKTEDNYKKMIKTEAETSPLPREERDVATRAIPIDTDAPDEPVDKEYIEAELDVEKHGVPVIDVERPPVPEVHTDNTKYKKVAVKRKQKRSDKKAMKAIEEELSLREDREMSFYAEKMKIPKRKSLLMMISKKLYELSCKIQRFALNRQRKKLVKASKHNHEEHILPEGVKTVALKYADHTSAEELGRKRPFKRVEDDTSEKMQVVRNKRTGVVVVTPSIDKFKNELDEREQNIDDYELVESQIKG
jgi:hypothetical protein